MVVSALANLTAIADATNRAHEAVNSLGARGVVIHISNTTEVSLDLGAVPNLESGEFVDPPDPSIPAAHVSVLGVKGSLLSGFAAQGSVEYFSPGLDLRYYVDWEVPLVGENSGTSRLDGGAREYFDVADSVGGTTNAVAKHEISFAPTSSEWKRCAACASLNQQSGGLDYACAAAGTHDNSVSGEYRVISRGWVGVNPVVGARCSACQCMLMEPGSAGPCPGAGTHIPVADESYTLVNHAQAPGESGWQFCGLCAALVIDASRPCPSGGAHAVVDLPPISLWTDPLP
jgi:hypothetical protein